MFVGTDGSNYRPKLGDSLSSFPNNFIVFARICVKLLNVVPAAVTFMASALLENRYPREASFNNVNWL
jgi:hypothetical protein